MLRCSDLVRFCGERDPQDGHDRVREHQTGHRRCRNHADGREWHGGRAVHLQRYDLPAVRAVGDAIGKQVTWDGGSKTVYLGEAPNSKKWMIDLCPPYESFCYETPSSFKMSGKTYTHGFTLNWMGYGLFNLNGNYETLSCDIGHVDGTSMNDAQVEIYLDGDLSQIIEVGAEDLVTHIDIPLHHALQMKIIMNQLTLTGFANCELS